jgi:hypothetical protein
MITVPITIGFDSPAESIGHAYIDETKLPEAPNWCLALGFKALDTERIVSNAVAKLGITITDNTPIIAMTTISSNKVNPRTDDLILYSIYMYIYIGRG